jgi:quercetin dioxygenase-like cupin family protein
LKVQNYRQVEGVEVVPGVVRRIVAGPEEGAPTFVMRVFEIQPGSSIPSHEHQWEHEIFVISGEGTLRSGEKDIPLKAGDAVTVLAGETHGFINTGNQGLNIICVVPLIDGKMPGIPISN